MNPTTCTEQPDCPCDDCIKARISFQIWCDTFDQRWQERKTNRKVIQSHAWGDTECNGPLCPEHGDVRDHSAVRP